MTLARTALRLCAVAAIGGTAAARPTIAQGRVYDSRISDLSPETYAEDAKPIVIVLTDADEGEQLSRQNGGPPFRRMIDLVLELGMVQSVKDEGSNEFIVGYPDTDARHEASLDFLEFQIMRELAIGQTPIARQFRRFARIVKADSHRQVLDDTGVKIAARIVTLVCDTKDDQLGISNSSTPATGLNVLPEPLASVAALLPPGSSGADVVAALAAAITPIEAAPIAGISFKIDANPASGGTANAEGIVQADIDLPSNTPTEP